MGYVYLVSNGQHYKIGCTSRNPEQRIAELQTGSAQSLLLIALLETTDEQYLESELHRQFAHCNVRGEWFDLTPYDIARFKEYEQTQHDQGSIIRTSPFDVRPIRWRQQYHIADIGKDVSRREHAIDSTSNQYLFHVMRRKHQIGVPSILWEERQNDCTGDSELHQHRAILDPDFRRQATADLFSLVQRQGQDSSQRRPPRQRHSKSKRATNDHATLEFDF